MSTELVLPKSHTFNYTITTVISLRERDSSQHTQVTQPHPRCC